MGFVFVFAITMLIAWPTIAVWERWGAWRDRRHEKRDNPTPPWVEPTQPSVDNSASQAASRAAAIWRRAVTAPVAD